MVGVGGVMVGGCMFLIASCSDLVIGAYESRQVFVLRSRTVVVINATITADSSSISITSDAQKSCEVDRMRYNW